MVCSSERSAITGDNSVKEGIVFSFILFQQLLTDSHLVVILFQGEHLWHPFGTSFAVPQRGYYLFHCPMHTPRSVLSLFATIRRLNLLSLLRCTSFSSLVAVLGRPEQGPLLLCDHFGCDRPIF